MLDLRKLLSFPEIYNLFNNFVGGRDAFARDFIRAKSGDRILDIGCGPGSMLKFMPEGADYVGADMDARYIESARKAYGSRGRFICQRVDRSAFENGDGFDIVIAAGLVHHLNDTEADELFDIARHVLKPGGRLITLDGCYAEGQSALAKFIVSKDRGQFVRQAGAYPVIAKRAFPQVKASVLHRLMRIPYTVIIMECTKASVLPADGDDGQPEG